VPHLRLGTVSRLGVAGGATALLAYYALGSIALAVYLWSGRSVVHLAVSGVRFRWPLFRDILRVGAVAAVVTVGTNLTIAIATGFVGRFGPAAIAGYGTGSRLEYLLVPLVFGLGGPLVAIVGTNIGAGQRDRALRAAWIGAFMAAGLCEAIGLCAAIFPRAWLSLFDTDTAMLDAGSRYLHTVGPLYGLFGLGMALYFASQGAGRLLWPLLANLVRLAIAAGGGWLALSRSGDLRGVRRARRRAGGDGFDKRRGGGGGRLVWPDRLAGGSSRPGLAGVTERYLEDFAVGQTFCSGRLRVDVQQIKAFAAEFDPQPSHLDEEAARNTIFRGLSASGWHTAAITMRLLVDSELKPAGGIIGVGFDELRWPRPVRPGDELRVESEVLEVRPSRSRPEDGLIKVRATTLNQQGEAVQIFVANLLVPRRPVSSDC